MEMSFLSDSLIGYFQYLLSFFKKSDEKLNKMEEQVENLQKEISHLKKEFKKLDGYTLLMAEELKRIKPNKDPSSSSHIELIRPKEAISKTEVIPDPNAIDCEIPKMGKRKYTQLSYAIYDGDESLFKSILLRRGVDVNKACEDTYTSPLHLTVQFRRAYMAKKLLQEKADINILNVDKNTPLHYAVSKGEVEMVDIFISHKASLTIFNATGFTALHTAVMINNQNIVFSLVKAGADVDIKSKMLGQSSVEIAEFHKLENILGLLKSK